MSKDRPASTAEREAKAVARHGQVDRRTCANRARRKRLERYPLRWLKWYLSETYTRRFEKPHKDIVAGAMNAYKDGGRFVVAAERGIGKSVLLWGMILYLALSGKRKYPVCIPWAAPDLKRAFRFWKNALCFNPRIDADYPEFTAPFVHAKGVSQRVATTTWKDTGDITGAQLTVGEGMIVLPSMIGCIGGCTINGNVRGLNHPQEDGTVLRPDIALLDDVQDRKTAKSQMQITDTINVIDGDVAGIGEAGKDLPILMSGNCTCPNDVMEHYLTDPDWHALKIGCVIKWPDGWDDDESEAKQLWTEWKDTGDTDRPKFYRKHRKKMVKGMKLSAPSAFKKSEKIVDAFYGAIRMYYRMGHEAFMAERQQSPIDSVAISAPYEITPDLVMARATDRKPLVVPEWVHAIHASTDVNPSYALSTVIIGMGQDQTCAVLWYGLHKCNVRDDLPKPEFDKQLYAEIIAHGKELAAMPVNPETWAIDGGGKNFDAVIRAAAESARACGIPAAAYTGRAWKHYRESGKTYQKGQPQREYCNIRSTIKDGRKIRWIVWHADYWREIAQRAWLGDPGAPGACTLPAGKHREFGAQICGDKLQGKDEVGGEMVWNWHTVPGKHDFGDAMAQGYALAAFGGIGTGGQVKITSGRKKYTQKDLRR